MSEIAVQKDIFPRKRKLKFKNLNEKFANAQNISFGKIEVPFTLRDDNLLRGVIKMYEQAKKCGQERELQDLIDGFLIHNL